MVDFLVGAIGVAVLVIALGFALIIIFLIYAKLYKSWVQFRQTGKIDIMGDF
jgi:hypothetical protein